MSDWTTSNIDTSPQQVAGAIADLPRLVGAEASKGTFEAPLAADVLSIMTTILQGLLPAQGASAQASLFAAYLDTAVAGAQARANARNAAGAPAPSSTATDPFGLGPPAGWPPIPPAGPGGIGWSGPGSGQEPWDVVKPGQGGTGLNADPGLSLIGAVGGSGFYGAGPGSAVGQQAVASQGSNQQTLALPIQGSAYGSGAAAAYAAAGGSAKNGVYASYYNPGPPPTDDETFVLSEWLWPGVNPLMVSKKIDYAMRMHEEIILPCARYYKGLIYGDPDYAVRLGQVLYGIMPDDLVRSVLGAGPTSRHLLGQAVNFSILGVDNRRVCDDIEAGNILVRVGTYGEVNGIHASMPFTVNGIEIDHMRLRSNSGVPGFVGYSFRQSGRAA